MSANLAASAAAASLASVAACLARSVASSANSASVCAGTAAGGTMGAASTGFGAGPGGVRSTGTGIAVSGIILSKAGHRVGHGRSARFAGRVEAAAGVGGVGGRGDIGERLGPGNQRLRRLVFPLGLRGDQLIDLLVEPLVRRVIEPRQELL